MTDDLDFEIEDTGVDAISDNTQVLDIWERSLAVASVPTPTPLPAETTTGEAIWENVKRHVALGDRVTWLKTNGRDFKLPLCKGYLETTWDIEELDRQRQWAGAQNIEVVGYGVVNGPSSGHRHVIDFDKGELLEVVADRVKTQTGFDLMTLPRVRSGRTNGKGYHLVLKSTDSVSKRKLAMVKDGDTYKVAVELCGIGSQTVGTGSLHKSRNLYLTEYGDPINPPVIPFDTFNAVLKAIETFDERIDLLPALTVKSAPASSVGAYNRIYSNSEDATALDVIREYESRNGIDAVLLRNGYIPTGTDSYKHPNNGENEQSVSVIGDKSIHFSPNDPMSHYGNPCRGGCGVWAGAFDVYVALQHNGDRKRAIKDLGREYGLFKDKTATGLGDWSKQANDLDTLPDTEIVQSTADASNDLMVVKWDDVDETVDWLWTDKIPLGAITLFAGEGGLGKSTAVLDLAACVSNGRAFPNGENAPLGDVILFSAEDADKVAKKRLRQQGANLTRVHKIDGERCKDGKAKYFEVADIGTLKKAIKLFPHTKLIVIDPIASYVGSIDSHKNADVRRVLTPIVEFAEEHSLAVILVIHLNKDDKKDIGNRITGSGAWRDLARSVWFVAKDKTVADRRYLFHNKSNYSAISKGYVFSTEGGVVKWQGETEKTISEVMGMNDIQESKGDRCQIWLKQKLTDCGATLQKEIESEAKQLGFGDYSLRAAKKNLNVEIVKEKFGSAVKWKLPGDWDE